MYVARFSVHRNYSSVRVWIRQIRRTGGWSRLPSQSPLCAPGNFQRAIEEFDTLPVSQRTLGIHLYRALCWANLGKDQEARAEIASARGLIPKDDEWDAESLAIERVRGF